MHLRDGNPSDSSYVANGLPTFGEVLATHQLSLERFILSSLDLCPVSADALHKQLLRVSALKKETGDRATLTNLQYGMALNLVRQPAVGAVLAQTDRGPSVAMLQLRLAQLPVTLAQVLRRVAAASLSIDAAAVLMMLPLHMVDARLRSTEDACAP